MKHFKINNQCIIYEIDYENNTLLVPKEPSKVNISDDTKNYNEKCDIIYKNFYYFINTNIKKSILDKYLTELSYIKLINYINE